jgi:hypothetical protein
MTVITDPEQAAAADVQAALHLPGAERGWLPRTSARLPAGDGDRRSWLVRYADAIKAAAEAAPPR